MVVKQLYESQEMKTIFEFFLKGDDFKAMLKDDPNLNKNPTLCKETSDLILKGFEKSGEDSELSG